MPHRKEILHSRSVTGEAILPQLHVYFSCSAIKPFRFLLFFNISVVISTFCPLPPPLPKKTSLSRSPK
ncbi:hypothetical protein LX32DRAFT_643601 [Colletotrichum zoysiae]|uniref:Uncharacterized protein n=1 Tax=Colletotrichum zoysiae TaxID=1216348 RepID=A0AAD9HAC1_9PEZI|nr:hypothetical protein LX32DRAFT_643601 [Colletotrichum zoysiae]